MEGFKLSKSLVVSLCLIGSGIIHLLPATGLLGVGQLNRLYGIVLDDTNLEILMRHRALMFGVLGAFLVYAAFKPDMQYLAIVAGLVSAVGFVVIAQTSMPYSEFITKIVFADYVALAALLIAGAIKWFQM